MEWICFTVSGTSSDPHHHRQRDDRPGPRQADGAVRAETVDDAGEDVDDRGGNAGDDHAPAPAGVRRRRTTITGGPRLRGSTGCSEQSPRGHGRALEQAVLAQGQQTRTASTLGWYLQVGACGDSRRGRERAQHEAENLHAAAFNSSSTRSPSHAGPCAAAASIESGPDHEHVVAARRDLIEAGAPELAELPLDAVSLNGCPGVLRHGEAEPRVVVLFFAGKPVQDEVACRRRAALPVDGVEVLRSAEPVPALHDSSD